MGCRDRERKLHRALGLRWALSTCQLWLSIAISIPFSFNEGLDVILYSFGLHSLCDNVIYYANWDTFERERRQAYIWSVLDTPWSMGPLPVAHTAGWGIGQLPVFILHSGRLLKKEQSLQISKRAALGMCQSTNQSKSLHRPTGTQTINKWVKTYSISCAPMKSAMEENKAD